MKENLRRFINLMFHKFCEGTFMLGLYFFLYIDKKENNFGSNFVKQEYFTGCL